MKKSGPRALSADELKLLAERVDLKTCVKYENSYEAVKDILNGLMGDVTEDSDEEAPKTVEKKATAKPVPPKTMTKTPPVGDADDKNMDELLKDLD